MAVAGAYEMLRSGAHDNTTVRVSFIIDSDGIVRTTTACPMVSGRSVEKILRSVRALPTNDARNVFTSEARHPGNRVVKTAPAVAHKGTPDRDLFHQTIEQEFDK